MLEPAKFLKSRVLSVERWARILAGDLYVSKFRRGEGGRRRALKSEELGEKVNEMILVVFFFSKLSLEYRTDLIKRVGRIYGDVEWWQYF